MTFGDTTFFALAVLLALMMFAVYRLARWRLRAREAFAGPRSRSWPSLAFWPRYLLLLGAATLIVLAAARPQWGNNQFTREVEGIDIAIVLDISLSMTAEDTPPNRLRAAQDNLVSLVQAQHGSRFGFVIFAGTAFFRSPLTSDTSAMSQLIQRADREGGLTRGGSDLGAALEQAGRVLTASENAGRAVILVSDGEDHVGTYEAQAAALAEQGIAIFTVGVGTPQGGQIYDILQTGEREPRVDEDGLPVMSYLDESSLRAIAEIGGGQYVHLDGSSSTALLALRNDLARLDQTPLGAETQVVPIERFQYFVAAGLVLLLLSWFLPSRLPRLALRWPRRSGRRPAIAALLLAMFIGGCSADSLWERNEAANEHYREGSYNEAAEIYQDLVIERPDIDEFTYNLGNVLHRLGAFERAASETQRALPPQDPSLGARTYYALGNHFLALERLDEAYNAYRNALLLDPNDADAKHNLEYVLRLASPEDQPPPDESPGDAPGPPPGQGPDEPADDGDEDPAPGPGDAPTTPDENGEENGEATAPGEPEPNGMPEEGLSPEALQRALADALAGIDEELTFEDAVRILDLLRQQQERRLPAAPGTDGPDY